jgi:hypothetical protein
MYLDGAVLHEDDVVVDLYVVRVGVKALHREATRMR